MKVLILTEGGKNKGFGHITRCISLYQAFEKKGIRPEFIINGDDSIRGLLKNIRYKTCDWLEERQDLFDIARKFDAVIIDSYFVDFGFYNEISEIVKIAVYLDDDKRIRYPGGIVVNGTVFSEKLNYPKKERVDYLLGNRYALLRREFWEAPKKKIKKNIETIMITFGNDDRRNMASRILKLMVDNYPGLNKKIVVGGNFKSIKEVKTLKDKKTTLLFCPNAEDIKRTMLESDVAISAGGQTLNELARVGVPTVAIGGDGNQLNNIRGWKKAGFIEYAGWWENKDLLNRIIRCIKRLKDKEIRDERSAIGRQFVDGKGAKRIVERILNEQVRTFGQPLV